MRGTESFDWSTGDMSGLGFGPAGRNDVWPIPPSAASVRVGGIRTFWSADDEGEPVLVVSDGVTTVEFGCGLPGPNGRTTRGAERLADAMRQFAAAIEARAAAAKG
jgi:hypothetical protein